MRALSPRLISKSQFASSVLIAMSRGLLQPIGFLLSPARFGGSRMARANEARVPTREVREMEAFTGKPVLKASKKTNQLVAERYKDRYSGKETLVDSLFNYSEQHSAQLVHSAARIALERYHECTFSPNIDSPYMLRFKERAPSTYMLPTAADIAHHLPTEYHEHNSTLDTQTHAPLTPNKLTPNKHPLSAPPHTYISSHKHTPTPYTAPHHCPAPHTTPSSRAKSPHHGSGDHHRHLGISSRSSSVRPRDTAYGFLTDAELHHHREQAEEADERERETEERERGREVAREREEREKHQHLERESEQKYVRGRRGSTGGMGIGLGGMGGMGGMGGHSPISPLEASLLDLGVTDRGLFGLSYTAPAAGPHAGSTRMSANNNAELFRSGRAHTSHPHALHPHLPHSSLSHPSPSHSWHSPTHPTSTPSHTHPSSTPSPAHPSSHPHHTLHAASDALYTHIPANTHTQTHTEPTHTHSSLHAPLPTHAPPDTETHTSTYDSRLRDQALQRKMRIDLYHHSD
ncbi:hypothetical protein B484DRAFT_484132 [Ochromonadaceae sp. CCMP2298]|nr:hypothetical protein B484DRAFT_484132 [Ochromonadaceae sp. CCMP2298]